VASATRNPDGAVLQGELGLTPFIFLLAYFSEASILVLNSFAFAIAAGFVHGEQFFCPASLGDRQ